LFSHHLRPANLSHQLLFPAIARKRSVDGTLNPAMEAGRKRGIIFDLGSEA